MKHTDTSRFVDKRFGSRLSIALRYQKSGCTDLDGELLRSTSMREGERIFFLLKHKGVDVYILDETSFMTTNTFEALVAMISVAHCKKLKRTKVIFSSGGNLGVALAAYCGKAGISALSFNPLVNVPFLDGTWFGRSAHLVAVENTQRTRETMLVVRKKMREALGYDPLIPTIPWRLEANRFRGFAILEFAARHQLSFSAICQTVSAGFGPLGTYETIERFVKSGSLPMFLGVQQHANAYMYKRWKQKKVPGNEPLIVPTLFDKNPHKTFGTYPAMARLLKKTQGDIVSVDGAEFSHYISKKLLQFLAKKGLRHTRRKGEIMAKSGLLALAGALKAIDHRIITKSAVLVCMTDGAQKIAKSASPELVIRQKSDVEKAFRLLQ